VTQDASDEVAAGAEERLFAAFQEGLEEGLKRLAREIAEAAGREQAWSARVRAGLEAMLQFLDDQPLWGRLFLSEAPPKVELECAQRVQGLLGELLDDQPTPSGAGQRAAGAATGGPPELTRELVLGGVFSVIRARLLDPADTPAPLVALAPSLMSFIDTAYLGYPDAGGSRPPAGTSSPDPSARASVEAPASVSDAQLGAVARGPAVGSNGLPIRATYRTMCVLRAIDSAPGSSNREVAQAAELTDEGQTSKLLGRLERRGLIENVGLGAAYGEPNAWLLTGEGRQVVKTMGHGFAVLGRGRRVRGAA
jgi:hypothetical protein